jgi:hypothetical protein
MKVGKILESLKQNKINELVSYIPEYGKFFGYKLRSDVQSIINTIEINALSSNKDIHFGNALEKYAGKLEVNFPIFKESTDITKEYFNKNIKVFEKVANEIAKVLYNSKLIKVFYQAGFSETSKGYVHVILEASEELDKAYKEYEKGDSVSFDKKVQSYTKEIPKLKLKMDKFGAPKTIEMLNINSIPFPMVKYDKAFDFLDTQIKIKTLDNYPFEFIVTYINHEDKGTPIDLRKLAFGLQELQISLRDDTKAVTDLMEIYGITKNDFEK